MGFMVQRGCPSESGGRGAADGEPRMLRRWGRRALAAAALCVGRNPVSLRAEAAFPGVRGVRLFTEGEERAVPEEQREAGSPTAEVGIAVERGRAG